MNWGAAPGPTPPWMPSAAAEPDAALAALAAGFGPQAEQAMRLLTLQVLSKLGAGGTGRGSADPTVDFEDYAFRLMGGAGGGTGGSASSGPDGGIDGGRGGSAQMLRIQRAIQKDPMAWVAHYNEFLRKQLGAEELGTGWSAAEYGRRRIEFTAPRYTDMEHCFQMLAEVHRLLNAGQTEYAFALVCQSLKACEQVILDKGDWSLAWSMVGLPELRGTNRVRRGGAHPVELSAGMAYLRELKTIEEWRGSPPKKGGGGGGGSKGPAEQVT